MCPLSRFVAGHFRTLMSSATLAADRSDSCSWLAWPKREIAKAIARPASRASENVTRSWEWNCSSGNRSAQAMQKKRAGAERERRAHPGGMRMGQVTRAQEKQQRAERRHERELPRPTRVVVRHFSSRDVGRGLFPAKFINALLDGVRIAGVDFCLLPIADREGQVARVFFQFSEVGLDLFQDERVRLGF